MYTNQNFAKTATDVTLGLFCTQIALTRSNSCWKGSEVSLRRFHININFFGTGSFQRTLYVFVHEGFVAMNFSDELNLATFSGCNCRLSFLEKLIRAGEVYCECKTLLFSKF